MSQTTSRNCQTINPSHNKSRSSRQNRFYTPNQKHHGSKLEAGNHSSVKSTVLLAFHTFLHPLSKTQLQEQLDRGREITISQAFIPVHTGCYDKPHRLVAYRQQKCILSHSPGSWTDVQLEVLAQTPSGEGPSSRFTAGVLMVFSNGRRSQDVSGASVIRQ